MFIKFCRFEPDKICLLPGSEGCESPTPIQAQGSLLGRRDIMAGAKRLGNRSPSCCRCCSGLPNAAENWAKAPRALVLTRELAAQVEKTA